MKPTPERVRDLAARSRIAVSDAECERYAADIADLEALCAPLLALTGTCSESYRAKRLDEMRSDEPEVCMERGQIEALAPVWLDGYIPVPRAVEGGEDT